MNIYSVQPKTCYVPSWEKYKFATGGVRYERKFDLETETLIEEVAIKSLSKEEISDKLVEAKVITKEQLPKLEGEEQFKQPETIPANGEL